MPRVKRGLAARKKKKRVMKLASGFRGSRHKLNRTVQEAVDKAGNHAFRDRRARKREFRALWISRINAATRIHNLSYSKFISGLIKADVKINRKVLSELAISDPEAFARLVQIANTSAA
jgi:large subunit ribosomal protein L20